jgi:hypothetical protein
VSVQLSDGQVAPQETTPTSLDSASWNPTRTAPRNWARRRRLNVLLADARDAYGGEKLRFMTLPAPGLSQGAITEAFEALVRRIRARFGRFEYIRVTEVGKVTGVRHLHVVFTGTFIPQAWLSGSWLELTGSSVVDVRAVHDDNVLRYLSKSMVGYLSKDVNGDTGHTSASGGFRRSTMQRVVDELARATVSRNPSRKRPRRPSVYGGPI